ncbi:MAG: hypothetical protein DRJ34_00755 [Thermoprotei archaeon]|nr:MAG: hypothetical protein DRJ34_00755 [Thermoprotei archaeon]
MRMKLITEKAGIYIIETINRNPKTLKAILDNLPIESTALRWGDEIYFETNIDIDLENPQETVEKGDVAYWPPGKAICIFFGPTPISSGDEIRPASPVNVWGKILGEIENLKNVSSGEKIIITSA